MLHDEVWAEFTSRSRCLGAERRDYPEWHRGRERYFVWAIDAEVAPVRDRLAALRESLADYLIQPCARRAHVTVAVGGVLRPTAQYDDDITPALVKRQIRRVRSLALGPFSLVIGAANSFASAPFLEVADPEGALARLREALAPGRREFRATPYVPHVTVGIYSGDHRVADILGALGPRDSCPTPLAVSVDRLELCSYDATALGSPLEVEREIRFGAG